MRTIELKLPDELCAKLEERFLDGGSGRTLEDLVVLVLEELAADTGDVERREEELLEERLQSLGYLSKD